ncbi:DNA adenine methylase [Weissella paramesenteroides]
MIKSFLNYSGGKYKLLPQLQSLFPKDYSRFVDLFTGSGVVATNPIFKNVPIEAYDNNVYLIELIRYIQEDSIEEVLKAVHDVISRFNLSDTMHNGYAFYQANSSSGLASVNKSSYLQLRQEFNEQLANQVFNPVLLYVLIVFGFNNQLRFNKSGLFNNPVGKRDFNISMQHKLIDFSARVKELPISFRELDFREVNNQVPNTFFYVDPPYLITTAVYNENGGWKEQDEYELLKYLDEIHKCGSKFALSNVLLSKGKTNDILADWILANETIYQVHHLNKDYSNSNYQTNSYKGLTDEVLIVNY